MKQVVRKNDLADSLMNAVIKTAVFLAAAIGLGFAGFVLGGNFGQKHELQGNLFIAKIEPENNAVISEGDTVSIKFSAPLKKSTLTGNNLFAFDLQKERIIPISTRYNEALQTIFITVPPKVNSDIQIELTDQIFSEGGVQLAGGKRLFYTVKKPDPPEPAKGRKARKRRELTSRVPSAGQSRL